MLAKIIQNPKIFFKDDSVNSSKRVNNRLREFREKLLLSKAELARKAGVSVLTISRIESGMECRMDTKRKIILALGLDLSDKSEVFLDE